eukprot:scaffold4817_cov123-Skeletonema_dohrnii-CCMP3373.AAC.8
MLLRKYICRRLLEYYSQPAHKVVGTTHASVDFSSLLGQWHWKRTYKRLYKQQKGMWLTPVELFSPYYSNVFANFVSTSMKPMLESQKHNSDGFQIVELGGGRGTNAKALLNHLQLHHNDVYDRLTEYTIFDTSPTLHELQRQNLKIDSDHGDKINLVNVDMMEIAEGTSPFLTHSNIPTTLIALELLDNLPHDKIAKCFETDEILQAELIPLDDDCTTSGASSEAIIDTSKQYHEEFLTASDPLLQNILSIDPSLSTRLASSGPRWIPSVALGVLMRLFECRPNSAVAFADFDWLPPPDLSTPEDQRLMLAAEPALGDPIVTDMKGIDHPCYLTSPPDALCDILFPTDFARMASFTKSILRRDNERRAMPVSVAAMKQNDFLLQYGLDEVNKTKSWAGYSPLINDFGNCSVLAVTPHHLCK